ncbi:hypothetical protein J5491_01960 [Candidatus Saccharibacteria bacterium]|nr:hypothetical protein [Candidatus Saccharibacteria bacterium]
MDYLVLLNLEAKKKEELNLLFPFVEETPDYGYVAMIPSELIDTICSDNNMISLKLDEYKFSCKCILGPDEELLRATEILEEVFRRYVLVVEDFDWLSLDRDGWDDEFGEQQLNLKIHREVYLGELNQFISNLKGTPGF